MIQFQKPLAEPTKKKGLPKPSKKAKQPCFRIAELSFSSSDSSSSDWEYSNAPEDDLEELFHLNFC